MVPAKLQDVQTDIKVVGQLFAGHDAGRRAIGTQTLAKRLRPQSRQLQRGPFRHYGRHGRDLRL